MFLQNEELIIAGLAAFSVLLLLLFFLFVIVTTYKRGQQEAILRERHLKTEHENALLQNELEVQELMLKNISQEIHDNIGQTLTMAKLNLSLATMESQNVPDPKIINSKELLSKAIQDLRDLARSLNTDYIVELGLLRAIEYELELIRKTGVIKTSLEVTGEVRRLEAKMELTVFRVVQELFNNILKHAEAKHIMVEVNFAPSSVALQIHDNGKGFDINGIMENSTADSGLGLRNMYNRAKLIGATFEMKSVTSEGSTAILNIPTT